MGLVTHHGPIGVRTVGNLDCGSGALSPSWVTGNRAVCKSTQACICYSTIPYNVKWPPARWGFYSFRICTALLWFPPRTLVPILLLGGWGKTHASNPWTFILMWRDALAVDKLCFRPSEASRDMSMMGRESTQAQEGLGGLQIGDSDRWKMTIPDTL